MKKEKGITLIALVVTIIVLIILASISIGALTGKNGIINQSKEAKEQTEIAETEKKAIKFLVNSGDDGYVVIPVSLGEWKKGNFEVDWGSENLFANCSNVEVFEGTFAFCENLTGNTINLWQRVPNGANNDYIGVPDGQGCYYECEKLNDYYEIPGYWRDLPQ